VIVRCPVSPESVGLIVRCVRFLPVGRVEGRMYRSVWELEYEGDPAPREGWACLDEWMRPIRPGDITDEEVRDLYAPKIPETA
jgi:hypothetical protein